MYVAKLEFALEEKTVALAALTNLFDALDRHGIRYCHWKSTLRLEEGLAGETDLDLLVDRKHSRMFRQILNEHNVKSAVAPRGKRYPGVEDYLGLDRSSGKLFHLHTHYQLVLGEQYVKNYRLPLEARFLDSVRSKDGLRTPAPEMELTILSLRALLKYRDRDAIKDMLSIRSSGMPAHILKEFEYLLNQTSMKRVSQSLMQIRDVVPADTVLEFLNTVVETPRAGFAFYRLREHVRRALRVYQRYDRPQAELKYFHEAWGRRKKFRLSRTHKMTLPSGGVTLGLIGADGAGKSTMCKMLAQWLSWKLDVHVYYLGSKQPSLQSRLLYIFFRMVRRSHNMISGTLGETNPFVKLLQTLRQLALYTYHLSIGQDRYRRYLAGRKKALGGSIVLYDRYPLESLADRMEYRLLDGPQIQLKDGETSLIARTFARAEQKIYQNILLPDYLFVLAVSPQVSMQRKPDHKITTVEAKSRALNGLIERPGQFSGNVIHINADLPPEDVLSALKAKIWEIL